MPRRGCGPRARLGVVIALALAAHTAKGQAVKIQFMQQPTQTVIDAVITPAPKVGFYDALGKIVTTETSAVTVVLASNCSGLKGTTTVNAVAGVAKFDSLSVDTVERNCELSASTVGLGSILSATFQITPHHVSLSWTAPSEGCPCAYNLYRGVANGGPYDLINHNIGKTVVGDWTVSSGTTYYYVVTAFNGTGESSYSNQAVAKIP